MQRRLSTAARGEAGHAAPPLCDVCKEKRGLVFCVEDRAILCSDCDDPIHSANDLTAKHSRFLLVGAKLSAEALADQAIPSPDCSSEDAADDHSSAASAGASAPLDIPASNCAGGGTVGGSSISDYLTTICPGWRVEDLLADDDAFAAAAATATGKEKDERVPFMDADLFDVVAGHPEKRGAWAPHVPQAPAWCLDEVPVATMSAPAPAPVKATKQSHVRERHWNDSDAFAVPEFSPPPAAKRARPSPQFWCF
uniref:B box-type domain-containing protein n=1 Tax=Oryza brachyantha TaxID=4533 RepID=J3MHL1_ORYBR